MNELLRISVLARTALMLTVLVMPGRLQAAPGTILFSDNFERAALAPWTTTDPAFSGILTGPDVSNSPTRGASTNGAAVTVTSPTFSTAVPSAEVTIWIRRGDDAFSEDPDDEENLLVQYRRADNTWATLTRHAGNGTPAEIFQDSFYLPPDGLHGTFALRLQQTAGSGATFDF